MKINLQTVFFCTGLLCFSNSNAQSNNDLLTLKGVRPITNAMHFINQFRPVTYKYNNTFPNHVQLPDNEQFGFAAAEVKKILPALINQKKVNYSSGKNAFRSLTLETVDLEKLIPFLVGALKEQQLNIDHLQKQLNDIISCY